MRICDIADCSRPHMARGYCRRHYQQARRNGLDLVEPPSIEDRFWSRVAKSADCWIWTAAKSKGGYGQVRHEGIAVYAHRLAYELTHGPIPDGLELDHLCRTPACVNPAHLEPVTHRKNVLRGDSPAARQARQTHCKRGHEFTEENTIRQGNKRRCRTCFNARRRNSDASNERDLAS